MKKTFLSGMLIVVLIGIIAGLSFWLSPGEQNSSASPRTARDEPRISIALGFRPGVVVDLAFLQAVERGDFARQGIDVSLKPYGRADLIFAALNSGEIQGSLGVPLEPLLEQAGTGRYAYRGYLVWYFDDKTPYDGLVVRADSDVRSLADLKGQGVGSHPSKQVTFFVSRFLPESTVGPYSPIAPLASLDSGSMAAVYVLEPFVSIAKANPRYRVLDTNLISRNVFGNARVPAAVSVLSSEWIESNPDQAAKFTRLARTAYAEHAKTRDTNLIVRTLTAPRFGLTPEVAAQAVEPASSLPEDLDAAQFQRFVGELKTGGILSGDVTLEKLLYSPPAQ